MWSKHTLEQDERVSEIRSSQSQCLFQLMATPTVTEEVGDCFSLDGSIKQSGSAKLLVIQNILASWIVDVWKTILGLSSVIFFWICDQGVIQSMLASLILDVWKTILGWSSVHFFVYDSWPRGHSKHGGLLLSILTAWSGRGWDRILAFWILDVWKTVLGWSSVNFFCDLWSGCHSAHGGLLDFGGVKNILRMVFC